MGLVLNMLITGNDSGLTDLQRVPRRPPIDTKLIRNELKEYFITPQGKWNGRTCIRKVIY